MLIRALEPLEGIDADARAPRPRARDEDLCSGPGKLTQALGIGLDLNGTTCSARPDHARRRAPVDCARRRWSTGPRIGITKAVELPWRFCEAGSRYVSRPRPRAR